MDRGDGEAERFFFDQESSKVILSLRENYLADLEGLRPLASIFHNVGLVVGSNFAN